MADLRGVPEQPVRLWTDSALVLIYVIIRCLYIQGFAGTLSQTRWFDYWLKQEIMNICITILGYAWAISPLCAHPAKVRDRALFYLGILFLAGLVSAVGSEPFWSSPEAFAYAKSKAMEFVQVTVIFG